MDPVVAAVVAGVLDRERELLAVEEDGAADAIAKRPASFAVVVASQTAAALVTLARSDADLVAAARSKKDGHARALVWAASVKGRVARPATPERIAAIEELARSAGYVLVEPDRSPVVTALGRVRIGATALDRAIATIEMLGSIAHPLVFTSEQKAPKGVPKLRLERLGDVSVGPCDPLDDDDADDAMEEAALEILCERDAPLRFKDLLREVRTRIKASTDDKPKLAKAIYRASLHGRVELFAS